MSKRPFRLEYVQKYVCTMCGNSDTSKMYANVNEERRYTLDSKGARLVDQGTEEIISTKRYCDICDHDVVLRMYDMKVYDEPPAPEPEIPLTRAYAVTADATDVLRIVVISTSEEKALEIAHKAPVSEWEPCGGCQIILRSTLQIAEVLEEEDAE